MSSRGESWMGLPAVLHVLGVVIQPRLCWGMVKERILDGFPPDPCKLLIVPSTRAIPCVPWHARRWLEAVNQFFLERCGAR